MVKWASKCLEMHSKRHRFLKKIRGSSPIPPQMTRKCKIIVRNKVFECLTLLKIEVIEYGKMGFKMA